MATVAPPADQATDLLQKLSLDPQTKALEIPEPTKKPSSNQYGSVDSANATNGQIPSFERNVALDVQLSVTDVSSIKFFFRVFLSQ
ncbi:YTH domain-containing protein ECT4-like isoform X2 [Carya illinoinensis]|uniref:Uncharacterized protein n=1 Tax=Carya illinoinensis TaxID=32201 RepID=A0A8T1NK83_CARIL|nr:YTH domain-containing protein ECT4-like isoform X2 [Carya illinoinensis]KAG6630755.1 hypothetical protein CIPAW_13G041900 [Carya illinoinensis]